MLATFLYFIGIFSHMCKNPIACTYNKTKGNFINNTYSIYPYIIYIYIDKDIDKYMDIDIDNIQRKTAFDKTIEKRNYI